MTIAISNAFNLQSLSAALVPAENMGQADMQTILDQITNNPSSAPQLQIQLQVAQAQFDNSLRIHTSMISDMKTLCSTITSNMGQ